MGHFAGVASSLDGGGKSEGPRGLPGGAALARTCGGDHSAAEASAFSSASRRSWSFSSSRRGMETIE